MEKSAEKQVVGVRKRKQVSISDKQAMHKHCADSRWSMVGNWATAWRAWGCKYDEKDGERTRKGT